MAIGDFDGDGSGDLGIGARGAMPCAEGCRGAGTVTVIYGSPSGLSAAGNQLWSEASPGIPGSAEPDDGFGSAVAAADFDGNGRDDLAVGVPAEDPSRFVDKGGIGAGAVYVLYGTASGIRARGAQRWTQTVPGCPGA